MPLTRGERFDRGDFEARDKALRLRSETEKAVAVARGAAAQAADLPGAPPDSPEQAEARAHLAELGYTAQEIEQLIAGPKAG